MAVQGSSDALVPAHGSCCLGVYGPDLPAVSRDPSLGGFPAAFPMGRNEVTAAIARVLSVGVAHTSRPSADVNFG